MRGFLNVSLDLVSQVSSFQSFPCVLAEDWFAAVPVRRMSRQVMLGLSRVGWSPCNPGVCSAGRSYDYLKKLALSYQQWFLGPVVNFRAGTAWNRRWDANLLREWGWISYSFSACIFIFLAVWIRILSMVEVFFLASILEEIQMQTIASTIHLLYMYANT